MLSWWLLMLLTLLVLQDLEDLSHLLLDERQLAGNEIRELLELPNLLQHHPTNSVHNLLLLLCELSLPLLMWLQLWVLLMLLLGPGARPAPV